MNIYKLTGKTTVPARIWHTLLLRRRKIRLGCVAAPASSSTGCPRCLRANRALRLATTKLPTPRHKEYAISGLVLAMALLGGFAFAQEEIRPMPGPGAGLEEAAPAPQPAPIDEAAPAPDPGAGPSPVRRGFERERARERRVEKGEPRCQAPGKRGPAERFGDDADAPRGRNERRAAARERFEKFRENHPYLARKFRERVKDRVKDHWVERARERRGRAQDRCPNGRAGALRPGTREDLDERLDEIDETLDRLERRIDSILIGRGQRRDPPLPCPRDGRRRGR